jgi:hypothetical protein
MTTTTNTKMQIGYKFEVKTENGVVIHAAKGRKIAITVDNDLFTVLGFTLRGVEMKSQVKKEGVFISQLQEAIIEAARI